MFGIIGVMGFIGKPVAANTIFVFWEDMLFTAGKHVFHTFLGNLNDYKQNRGRDVHG